MARWLPVEMYDIADNDDDRDTLYRATQDLWNEWCSAGSPS